MLPGGFLSSPFKAQTFIYINPHLGMPCASGMAGSPRLPSTCVCGKSFTVDHSLSCQHGGYLIHQHNDLQDYAASFFSKVCLDVSIEPLLQSLFWERVTLHSANRNEGVRLNIEATNFWNGQHAFFDIRVFSPLSINSYYQKHEKEKQQRYDQRVRGGE